MPHCQKLSSQILFMKKDEYHPGHVVTVCSHVWKAKSSWLGKDRGENGKWDKTFNCLVQIGDSHVEQKNTID